MLRSIVLTLHSAQGWRCNAEIGSNVFLRDVLFNFWIALQQFLELLPGREMVQIMNTLAAALIVLADQHAIKMIGFRKGIEYVLHVGMTDTQHFTGKGQLYKFTRRNLFDKTFGGEYDTPFIPKGFDMDFSLEECIRQGKSFLQEIRMVGNSGWFQ